MGEYQCGYEWLAPLAKPREIVGMGGAMTSHLPQKCTKPAGHDGPHRSSTNCIAPNHEKP